MEEYLDYYDYEGNYLGKKTRKEVHEEGLWHNTIHCWLYTKDGNILFQVRSENNKLYTTASGHVLAGETLKEAFKRETKEEIGIDVNIENAIEVEIYEWKMDKIKNGVQIKDRAKSHIYLNPYNDAMDKFKFDETEVTGVCIVNAKETLELFKGNIKKISALYITNSAKEEKELTVDNFQYSESETPLSKYGKVLEKVIELSK